MTSDGRPSSRNGPPRGQAPLPCEQAPLLRERLRADDGNTLLLMPAAVLVVIILAGIAVDLATVWLGYRRVADLAASIANDAVAAVDFEVFYGNKGKVQVVSARAQQRADVLVQYAGSDRALLNPACRVEAAADSVTVHCTAAVEPIFSPGIFDAIRRYEVRATATARAASG